MHTSGSAVHLDDGHHQSLLQVLKESRRLGFLGPGDIESQVLHAYGFVELLIRLAPSSSEPLEWLDIGAGGGLPGLVIAHALVDSQGVLLDAMEKRADFLRWALPRLGAADRVSVVRARAEEWAHHPGQTACASVVVARGFGPPALTAECAARFLRVGGRLVVSEPPMSDGERWAGVGASDMGLHLVETVQLPAGSFAVLTKVHETPDALPRRGAALVKRPLF